MKMIDVLRWIVLAMILAILWIWIIKKDQEIDQIMIEELRSEIQNKNHGREVVDRLWNWRNNEPCSNEYKKLYDFNAKGW